MHVYSFLVLFIWVNFGAPKPFGSCSILLLLKISVSLGHEKQAMLILGSCLVSKKEL